VAAARKFITEQHKAGKPFFVWWNGTRMHFRTHVKAEHRGISGQDEYSDGMVEHDMHVGELLKVIDELGLANDTIIQYSTDNGVHYNTWPDAGTTQYRRGKNTNWEGAYRVSCFVRWPGKFMADKMLNGIVAHEDWLTACAAAAGAPDIKEKPLNGVTLNGRSDKNHLDSYNQLDYLSGKAKESPREEFIYVNDVGEIVAARVGDWKAVYTENRAQTVARWREPFVEPAGSFNLSKVQKQIEEMGVRAPSNVAVRRWGRRRKSAVNGVTILQSGCLSAASAGAMTRGRRWMRATAFARRRLLDVICERSLTKWTSRST
jgi:arylsulfatase